MGRRYGIPRLASSSTVVLTLLNLASVIFLVLAISIMLGIAWWWLLIIRPMVRARRAGQPIPLASSLALQASIGGAAITALLQGGGFWELVSNLALPPALPLLWLIDPPAPVRAVVAQNRAAIVLGLLGAVAVVVAMAAMARQLLRVSLIPALAVAIILLLALAERRSAARMEARAAELHADCLVRHSFRESLGFWGEEFQWDLHASARIKGEWYGWSYREDDFYRIPERAPTDGNGLKAACFDQIGARPTTRSRNGT